MTDIIKTPKVDSTLSKGVAILENLAATRGSKGVTELSRELELTKSNTFRLLQTLTTLGYVKHLEDKTYAATLKTWQVGRALVENLNLRAVAAPELAHLSQETGEAIYLAVPEGLSVVYIDKVESLKPIRSWNPVGGSAPIHCVGTGKAILANCYMRMREKLDGKLDRYTDNTLTTLAELDVDLAETRKRGYAFDRGEFSRQDPQLRCGRSSAGWRADSRIGNLAARYQHEQGRRETFGYVSATRGGKRFTKAEPDLGYSAR